jgi:hypothetical protein
MGAPASDPATATLPRSAACSSSVTADVVKTHVVAKPLMVSLGVHPGRVGAVAPHLHDAMRIGGRTV